MFFSRWRKKKTETPAVSVQEKAKESKKPTVTQPSRPMKSAAEPVEKDIAEAYKARGNKPALHQGPVHMRGDGIFCQSCGKKIPKAGHHILGNNYCDNCYSVLEESTTLPCARCGKMTPYKTMIRKLCPDCWLQEIEGRRSFYRYYGKMLEMALKERGIDVLPEVLDGITVDGKAVKPVIHYPWLNTIPLRHNNQSLRERALYTVPCRGGMFAMPDNGIALRYLSVPATLGFQKWVKDYLNDAPRSYLAAIRSDGQELYIAEQNGEVWSSTPGFEPFILFDIQAEVRRICSLLPEEKIQAAADRYQTGIHHFDHFYYDGDHKKFFEVLTDGNYYHGYDVSYRTVSKAGLLSQWPVLNYSGFYDLYVQCLAGKIPLFAIVERLEEDETLTDYQPPEGTGCGIDWV